MSDEAATSDSGPQAPSSGMPRPLDMGPADLAPDTAPPHTATPDEARKAERNAYYNSLAVGAKDRFLAALERAAERGADEETAWEEAVLAVQEPEGKL